MSEEMPERFEPIRDAMQIWFRPRSDRTLRSVLEEIEQFLLRFDERIDRQLNAILHHAKFQKLEARWRGVKHLVEQTPVPDDYRSSESPQVKIKVYSITWDELAKDLIKVIRFDLSYFFRHVYTANYGTLGGEPIGLLIGDFHFEPNSQTCEILKEIASVGAASFCPFIAGVSSQFWGVDSFTDLQYPGLIKLASASPPDIPQVDWDDLRNHEDSRFIGLAVPRVLLRRPHGSQAYRCPTTGKPKLFRFKEDTTEPDLSGMLWGSAAWGFGEVVIREFLKTRWFGEMLGIYELEVENADPELLPHGIVVGLPRTWFSTDPDGMQPKAATDLLIDEVLEQLFVEQGFLTLSRCPGRQYSAFYAAPSIQISKEYSDRQATENAKLSATLDGMLCVSRFAHYLKQIGRSWLGAATSAEDIEKRLHNWLAEHTSDPSEDTASKDRAAKPLTEFSVGVTEIRGRHGVFDCQIHLRPRLTPDGLMTSIQLRTELASPDADL